MSYVEISDGELAAVVTFLEMRQAPTPDIPPSSLRLKRKSNPGVDEYRALFRLVGAPWLWFSRLIMGDDKLTAIIGDPKVQLFLVEDQDERAVGMIELDFRAAGECELAFIGLIPELAGKGHGRWLLAEAVSRAWAGGIARIHVHTCSLDHPAALSAYRRAGFTAYKRAIERFPDPRLLGILPSECAPHIPLLGTLTLPSERPAS